MIKNDGDIVEAFVRHHAMLFDHLVVLDHSSTDNTPAILRALQQEGLPLTVMRDESLSFQQGLRTTELARAAFARLGADFVFPLDADELLKVASRPPGDRTGGDSAGSMRTPALAELHRHCGRRHGATQPGRTHPPSCPDRTQGGTQGRAAARLAGRSVLAGRLRQSLPHP